VFSLSVENRSSFYESLRLAEESARVIDTLTVKALDEFDIKSQEHSFPEMLAQDLYADLLHRQSEELEW
jgi:hypothetical protein